LELTLSIRPIVGWIVALLEEYEFGSLSDCLERLIAEQSRAGSSNSILKGLASGMIDAAHPLIRWIGLSLGERMKELAEVPIDATSARGPPEAERIQ